MKEDFDNRVLKDKKLNLQFRFLDKLGKGAFGQVYSCVNLKNQSTVALKIQYRKKDIDHEHQSNLLREYSVLKILQGVSGVPKVFSIRSWSHGYALELEKMNSSLEIQMGRRLKFNDIRTMAVELLMILKKIHSKGIVHQDLKPGNIMRTQTGTLAIIDFGLSKKITPPSKYAEQIGFIGTPRYASLAAHKGNHQTPKDDIESLLYVLGFIYAKRAPWSKITFNRKNRLQLIYKYKTLKNKQWLQQCGKPFIHSYNYLEELDPYAEIDYGYIIKLFQYHRQSLVNDANKSPKYIRKMSTYADSPFIINIQQIKKQQTMGTKNFEIEHDDGLTEHINFFGNSQNNFSTEVFEGAFIERALSILTGTMMNSQECSSKSSEEETSKQKKTQGDDDEPSPETVENFKFPEFQNPFLKNS